MIALFLGVGQAGTKDEFYGAQISKVYATRDSLQRNKNCIILGYGMSALSPSYEDGTGIRYST